MTTDKISLLKESISQNESISDSDRQELYKIIKDLESEMNYSPQDSASNETKEENAFWESLTGSLERFEENHPELTKTVNSISNALSNAGL